ncbi:putative quinol monooxygenase [Nocardia asteroides]|uniref:putative quinol monooxygenase n=1 Tax=Nocardia asteroides TaxID=1824 RepID=UPI0037B47472
MRTSLFLASAGDSNHPADASPESKEMLMANPIVVVATMIAKPGDEDTVEKTLSAAAVSVHAEQGCLCTPCTARAERQERS